jgi:membrane-anchored glycerophosphoryl diester phosphodiesterase (GDPDase)
MKRLKGVLYKLAGAAACVELVCAGLVLLCVVMGLVQGAGEWYYRLIFEVAGVCMTGVVLVFVVCMIWLMSMEGAVEGVAAMGEDSRGALMSGGFIGVLVCVVVLILILVVMYWYIEFKDK